MLTLVDRMLIKLFYHHQFTVLFYHILRFLFLLEAGVVCVGQAGCAAPRVLSIFRDAR